jgi:hypothetical protein
LVWKTNRVIENPHNEAGKTSRLIMYLNDVQQVENVIGSKQQNGDQQDVPEETECELDQVNDSVKKKS